MVSSFSKIDNTSTVVGGGGITLRLHLVRHGETIANVQQNAIGQSDSVCLVFDAVVVAPYV
jgi:hypothetical protein